MSFQVTIAGQSYTLPNTGDSNWGDQMSLWMGAVSTKLLQKSGGSFVLTAEVDFGGTYGLKTAYFKSRTVNPATAGLIRFAVTDTFAFRNNANSGNLLLGVNASDQLTFDGGTFVTTLGTIVASRMVVTNSGGDLVTNSVTATEAGYLSGVTSALQTQLNAKEPTITTLSVAKGGTNSGTALSNNRVIRSTAGAIVEAAAITASRALISDGSGIPTHSATTSTELGYVSGVTSALQTQLNAKAPTPTAPTVQKFTSGSGTYTKPANVLYLKVTLVGGGGGGNGSGATTPAGGTGGDTTFGTTLLAGSGGAGATSGGAGGSGGAASLGSGPLGVAIQGSYGGGAIGNTAENPAGAQGGCSPFGGQGGSAAGNSGGVDGRTNSGSGGGGAGASGNNSGAGGGSGGYVSAIITSPSATYSYAVGAAGTAGIAGASGSAGGAGGSGIILVEEFYQ